MDNGEQKPDKTEKEAEVKGNSARDMAIRNPLAWMVVHVGVKYTLYIIGGIFLIIIDLFKPNNANEWIGIFVLILGNMICFSLAYEMMTIKNMKKGREWIAILYTIAIILGIAWIDITHFFPQIPSFLGL